MATLPENLCSVGSFEIPRPKCVGMQFVTVRGKYGYYQTVNKGVAIKYGIQQQQQRRPMLPDIWVGETREHQQKEGGTKPEEGKCGEESGRRMRKTKRDEIAEETEGELLDEPFPDYDGDERDSGGRRSEFGSFYRKLPPLNARPAPAPLSVQLRQSLHLNCSALPTNRKREKAPIDQFDLMANGAMSTFRDNEREQKEWRESMGEKKS